MISQSNNPLIKDLVNRLRDIRITPKEFRHNLKLLAQLLCMEACSFPLTKQIIPTWIGQKEFSFIEQENIVVVAILRAALPMQEGLLELFPYARGGFLAMKRDESTFEAKLYYTRLPDIEGKNLIVVDPMVATGGSLKSALDILAAKKPASITTLHVVGVKDGLEYVNASHPNAHIHIAQIDAYLNEQKYIIPGLGDAGDRAFHT
ncbi:uracil phosphoribosyltransferase [Nitratiruptor sp. YY08-26]|uniref:uracil phosphoribosyltransferase n=1 Tax=unclassified Nitratiruptor TaxID=2624044 RepID=UPI001914DDD0|nr:MULTISPECIES: uracil phosphoribosyltransferase [unclassified Nitratiruptor]BCD63052.1 uracil phosphoribosyltransferase [Nitratiruptor sp. YY08-13]BCD66987.1 uracil phosphoribosyltransferase [Nitratiruptor sp. YY08-26]